MRKYFLATSLLFTCLVSAFSQTANTFWIDSLKKQLSTLHDNARVDCLNELAWAFGSMGNTGWDSIYTYAIAANKEAVRIGYKKGEAFSLLNLAGSERKNLPAAEAYIKQAISIGENIKNSVVLGRAYLAWSWNLLNEPRMESLKKALTYFEQVGDVEGIAEVYTWLCDEYSSKGKYEEGFKYCNKCVQLSQQAARTPWGHELVLIALGDVLELYKNAGDFETALDYSRQSANYAQEHHLRWGGIDISLYTKLGQYDSALYYWKEWESRASTYALNHRFYVTGILEEIYLKTKQYDKALNIAKEGITFFKTKPNAGYSMTGHFLSAAKAYAEMKNYNLALDYAKEGIKLAEKNDIRPMLMDGYELIAGIYHHLKNNTNAYFYLQKHMILKDSIMNRQFFWQLNNYKKQAEEERKTSQINLLNKDNKLKEQQLKQQSTLKNSLIAGIVLLFLLVIFVFRSFYLKRKKQEAESEKKQTELEMQALRAQMNPHFIFNCLSSINRIIMKNDNYAASDYLTRFSRLMRMVLINSQKQLVSLEDELQMLRLYLDMERLRFKDAFEYKIIFSNTIDEGAVLIPPLLLQPFCENAIWHGLMQKDGPGLLTVELSMQENTLNCIITDNGIGREKAQVIKSKTAENQKSMGLKITTERLALLNREKGLHTYYEIEDLKDETGNAAGTRVVLKISFKETVEETA